MIRTVGETVIAFDCEWIPDLHSARLLFGADASVTDEQVMEKLWLYNGATAEDPHPFVRLMQSRVVSIAMVMRLAPKKPGDNAELRLVWLPKEPEEATARSERKVVGNFIAAIGNKLPQLVGFNSRNSDLRILAQRALAMGIPAKGFLNKPNKPWEGMDYLARDTECSIDLMDLIAGGFSGRNAAVNLHEAATLCGIPGKFDAHGDDVYELWNAGKYREIVQYNCFDALTTYLLWLRLAFVSGRFTADEYEAEQELLRQHLMDLCERPETAFVEAYLTEWDRMEALRDANP
ncbi:MAG: 3'-5' exonuclease [Kiritimatiellia bacterium]